MTRIEPVGGYPLRASRLHRGWCRLTRFGSALPLMVGLLYAAPAVAAAETFGPGRVSCQILDGDQADCLLSSSRITAGGRNEASFSLAVLAPGPRELFRKWCLHAADECIVTLVGERGSQQATRLSTVTSLQWRRPRAPRDQAEAAAP